MCRSQEGNPLDLVLHWPCITEFVFHKNCVLRQGDDHPHIWTVAPLPTCVVCKKIAAGDREEPSGDAAEQQSAEEAGSASAGNAGDAQ